MLGFLAALAVGIAVYALEVVAFDGSRYDNVVLYWGQNSYGAVFGNDTPNFQQRLSYYCNDNAADVIPVSFVNVFFDKGGLPSVNLANTCNPVDNATFPGSNLPDCSALASDIQTCQSKGKLVTLSLGGATGAVGFQSDDQATTFAQTVWDLFLGGSSSTRPFGKASLDGVDLDIEGGLSDHYDVFINKLRSLSSGAPKKYYYTAAPQCVYPDAALGDVLNKVPFDAIYIQFYNNPCGLPHFNEANNWDYGIWDNWARTISLNKNVKIYVGAPAAPRAAGAGYVDIGTLQNIAVQMRKSFPSFGGVMLWDASQAYFNSRYDMAIKNTLVAAGGTGFTFPACTAPAYTSGSSYTAGSQVSYAGYIWQAKWWASSAPVHASSGEWSAISACGGPSLPPSSSPTTTPTSPPMTSQPSTTPPTTTTTTPSTPTPSPGSCAGVSQWSGSSIYVKDNQVIYGSHLWTAKWWTQNDTPGGLAGVWTDNGPCGSTLKATLSAKSLGSSASENVRPSSRVKSRLFSL